MPRTDLMPRMLTLAALAAVTLATWPTDARSAEPATRATATTSTSQPDKVVVRVYDIRDLLTPSGGELVPQPVWTPAATSQPASASQSSADGKKTERQKMVELIIKEIQENIDPDSWEPKGQTGSIRELNGTLVIRQTLNNHGKIVRTIQDARETRTVSVLILAKVVRVSPENDKKVQEWLKELKSPLDEKNSIALLSWVAYDKLINMLEDGKLGVLTVPKALVYNDQQASMTSGNTRTCALPLEGNGTVDMVFHRGTTLQVLPFVASDRKYVTIEAVVTAVSSADEKVPTNYDVAQRQFTVNLPDEGALIMRIPVKAFKVSSVKEVAGADGKKSYEVVAQPQDAQKEPQAYIYLTLKPTIIVPYEVDGEPPWREVKVKRSSTTTSAPADGSF